jgi:biopolymer transport protein ExbB
MDGLTAFFARTDAVGATVAAVLLAMSISGWVVIVWKAMVLRRALVDTQRAVPAFWDAMDWDEGRARLGGLDRERVLLPLVEAALQSPAAGTLQTRADLASQLTRRLRDALQGSLATLQFGQVLLASIGSTAPFVGLFGTVWGIYQALAGIGAAGAFTIDRVSGPVGEALVMTAAGLAVAIPAVLAYNLYGKWLGTCEARLEGFAHDLRETLLDTRRAEPQAPL